GHDPRDFTFVAYGGAGPLHAAALARELGVTQTVIPPAPGNFSAFGMLLSEIRSDAVRTHVGRLDPVALAPLFDELEKEAREGLEEQGANVEVHRFAELRYVGQEHALEVPLDPGPVDEALMVRLRADFDRRSEEAYAFSLPVAVEIVSARVSVSLPAPPVRWTSAGRGSHVGRSFGLREVELDVHGGRRRARAPHPGARTAGRGPVRDRGGGEPHAGAPRTAGRGRRPGQPDHPGGVVTQRQRGPEDRAADRFTLDVLREAFLAVADEMFVSLQRTSQSPVIYEVLD